MMKRTTKHKPYLGPLPTDGLRMLGIERQLPSDVPITDVPDGDVREHLIGLSPDATQILDVIIATDADVPGATVEHEDFNIRNIWSLTNWVKLPDDVAEERGESLICVPQMRFYRILAPGGSMGNPVSLFFPVEYISEAEPDIPNEFGVDRYQHCLWFDYEGNPAFVKKDLQRQLAAYADAWLRAVAKQAAFKVLVKRLKQDLPR